MNVVRNAALVLLLSGGIALTGCKNNNLFGGLHREGSGDAQSLIADGQSALSRSEFASALAYFNSALAQDPSNAEALYGAAVAEMGLSGLDLGQLLSNLMTSNGGGGAPAFQGALSRAVRPAPSSTPADSVVNNIDVAALDNALGETLPRLETIHLGLAHGTISPNDPNLLINLGFCRLLRAVSRPLRQNLLDIRVVGSDYEAVLLATTPFSGGDCAYVDTSARNVVWAYQNLLSASAALHQTTGNTLFDIKEDVKTLFPVYKLDLETATGCALTVGSDPDAEAPPSGPTAGLNP